jgi:hypothetical protein
MTQEQKEQWELWQLLMVMCRDMCCKYPMSKEEYQEYLVLQKLAEIEEKR